MTDPEFERLVQFFATGGERFALALAVVRGAGTTAALVTRIRERLDGIALKLIVHTVVGEGDDLLANWEGQMATQGPRASVLICDGLGQYLVDPSTGENRIPPALSRLNQQRDELPVRFPHRVLLILSPEAVVAFRLGARDLADVVLSTFDFNSGDAPVAPSVWMEAYPEIEWQPDDSATPAQLERERALLRSIVERDPNHPGTYDALLRLSKLAFSLGLFQLAIDYLDQAETWAKIQHDEERLARVHLSRAQRHHFAGHYEAARQDAERAAKISTAQGDITLAANAKIIVTRVLEKIGRPEEALRLLQTDIIPTLKSAGDFEGELLAKTHSAALLGALGRNADALALLNDDVIPNLSKTGDPRNLAVAQGKLADILQRDGKLDESLQIRRTEELPVFEWLGDLRETAITKGKIADILRVRGQLDESLALYREHLVPIFTRLGETWELATAYGKIASILGQKGEWNQALKIRLEQELPLLKKLGRTPKMAEFHDGLGEVYIHLGREADAFAELESGYRLAHDLRIPEHVAATAPALALIYWRQNRRLDAKMVCMESAAFLRKIGRIKEASDLTALPEKLAAGVIL